jgi:hypothetical protein
VTAKHWRAAPADRISFCGWVLRQRTVGSSQGRIVQKQTLGASVALYAWFVKSTPVFGIKRFKSKSPGILDTWASSRDGFL